MLESQADDRWQRLLTKLRCGPCGIIKQGPFLSSPTLSARRGSVSIAYGRKKIDRLAQRLGTFLGVPVWDHVGAAARDSW